MEGCRDPAELVDYVIVFSHNLLKRLNVQTLLVIKLDKEVACLLLKLLARGNVYLHPTRDRKEN